MRTGKAVIANGQGEFSLEEIKIDHPGPGEVLERCGSSGVGQT